MGTLLGLLLLIAFAWIITYFVVDWVIDQLLKRFAFFTDETDFEAAKLMYDERKRWK